MEKDHLGRISDGWMLSLIKAWLYMPIEEDDGRGVNRGEKLDHGIGWMV